MAIKRYSGYNNSDSNIRDNKEQHGRSLSMISLHQHGKPKIKQPSDGEDGIPLEIFIPNTFQPNERKNNCSNQEEENKIVLVVVGMPVKAGSRLSKTMTYSQKDFPYFEHNLKSTIELCRNNPNADIIHISSSATSLPCSRGRRVVYSTSTRMNHHPARNPSDSTASSTIHSFDMFGVHGDQRSLCPTTKEILIPKPAWSSSCHILLREELKRISKKRRKPTKKPAVYVCGLNTSVCVMHTAIFCSESGYKTYLIEDACADRCRIIHDQALFYHEQQQQQQPYLHKIITSYRDIQASEEHRTNKSQIHSIN